jgi:PAS domain S-box-containing protein
VDDIPANLLALRALLDDLGQNLVEAGSGEQALQYAQTEEFAVVLLDVIMPGMSGFETARRLREDARSGHTPIIFLTATDIERAQWEQGYALGAVDFLIKPFLPVVLRAKVRGFIDLFQEKLRAKRQTDQFRLLVEGARDYAIFLLDPKGHIVSWNPGAERIKGYKAEEIIGQHFSHFYPQEAIDRGWPAYELKVAQAEGRFEDEGWRVRKDGSQFWANVIITALRDDSGKLRGFSKITRDITERKKAEESARRLVEETTARRVAEENARLIQEQRERLHVTLASIADAVISTDAQGRIDFLNPVAERLVAWKAEEAAGHRLEEVVHIVNETTRQPVRNPALEALKDGTAVGLANHTVLISRDGTERPIDDSAAPIRDAESRVIGSVLVFRDVSRHRLAEQHRNARMGVTQVLNQAATVAGGVAGVLRAVCESLAWDVGFFWTVNDEGTALFCKQCWQRPGLAVGEFESASFGRTIAKGQGLPGRVWESGQAAWIRDVTDDGNFPRRAAAASYGLHSAFACPVIVSQQLLGVIEFFTRQSREPDPDLLEMMTTIAGSLGQFIERKAAEDELRRSEAQFRQLADTMPQLVWTARPDGNIDYMNRRWTEYTGLPQTIGNEGWSIILHPEDGPSAVERWAASLQSGAPFEMEMRLLDRNQTYRWHLVRTVAIRDEVGQVTRWFGTGTDIQEQKHAEESARYLAEASAALAAVVDFESTLQKVAGLSVPYFADWSTVDVANEDRTLRRLAVAHQDPKMMELADALMREYPSNPQAAGGVYAVLRSGKPEIMREIPDELLVKTAKDEQHLQMLRALGLKSYICVPLIVSGHTFGVLTFATAQSGRRYSETDLALAMDLAHRAAVAIENTRLYQALRDTDRRKDEFLATLAHELRNPLAPIRNSLQILKLPRVDSETVERSRDMMERQVHHLVRLVDDLLDVSRVMRGKIELRKERVELATVVARAAETVQPLFDSQGQEFSVTMPPESMPLEADPVRLTQVVSNLLTNAAKYTEPRGRISLIAERAGSMAVLRIQDNGIGIAPAMLPRIFELFVQVDHAAARSQGGLGVGLTLVKNLVEMHNGTVEAHSEGLGKGSEFIVRLPLAAARLEEDQSPQVGHEADLTPVSSGYRLLIVDDNQDAANSLATLLRLQGHEVRVAYSGVAALAMTNSYVPDLVFLDIGMPGMDGYEVARRLRRQPGLENVVLAALTGWGQQEDRRRSAEAGFNHHLVKPPDLAGLEKLVMDVRRA